MPRQEALKHSKGGLAQSLTEGTAPFHKEINPECSLEGLMLKRQPEVKSQLTGKDTDGGKD